MLARIAPFVLFAAIAVGFLVDDCSDARFAEQVRRDDDAALLAACRGGNLRSAYERANRADGRQRLMLARDTLPIIDCEMLVAEGVREAVPYRVERRYMFIYLERRRWPIIEDGRVVATRALPGVARREGIPPPAE